LDTIFFLYFCKKKTFARHLNTEIQMIRFHCSATAATTSLSNFACDFYRRRIVSLFSGSRCEGTNKNRYLPDCKCTAD
jgi:hypothetical protein